MNQTKKALQRQQISEHAARRYLMLGLSLLCIVLAFIAGYRVGAWHTCNVSEGFLTDEGKCLNPSQVGYCQFNDVFYRMTPGLVSTDYNLSDELRKD